MEGGSASRPGVVDVQVIKPIRVIDLAATLISDGGVCFQEPDQSCDFHVISHTWSQDVRKFSEEIGLKAAGAANYNAAFQSADFRQNSCYKDLQDFLRMLQKDGVQYAWFDALCIDQTNQNEKGKEIARMASYYSESRGCYVLTHGIGQGYSFWKTVPPSLKIQKMLSEKSCCQADLPRWFGRVWTFQEYVLPKQLIFLVSFSVEEVSVINHYIVFCNQQLERKTGVQNIKDSVKKCFRRTSRSGKSGNGFCRCCLRDDHSFNDSFNEQYREGSLSLKSLGSMHRIDQIYEQEKMCENCGSFPLVRRAAGASANKKNSNLVYLVDREAYDMIGRLFFSTAREYFMPWSVQNICLGQLISCSDSPINIARHIIARECSNEEDRILAILGLLGCKNVEPVRTMLSLDDQILEVCKRDHDLLIQVCAMGFSGYRKRGMSWAPWLVDHRDGNSRFIELATENQLRPGPILKTDVEVVNVCAQRIELRACITSSRALLDGPKDDYQLVFQYGLQLKLSSIGYFRLCKWPHREDLERDDRLVHDLYKYELKELIRGYLQVPLRNYKFETHFLEFKMWWILLGDVRYVGADYKVAMACVGKSDSTSTDLHKVGLFWFPLGLASTVFQTPLSSCSIAGVGQFLDEFVIKAH